MPSYPSFGIQSYCYRNHKTIPQLAKLLKETGVNKTEICGVQINFDQPDTFDQAIAQIRAEAVQVLSIGVLTLNGNEAHDRNYFEFCKRVGCDTLSFSFPIDGLWETVRLAERLADEYDLKLGIHNHGGAHWLGNITTIDYVLRNSSKRIGVTLDTAWAIDAGQDIPMMIDTIGDRLYGLHIKDYVYQPSRKSEEAIIGEGNLDLPGLMTKLKQVGFKGFTVIEYEADPDNPVPALQKCVAKLKPFMP